MIRTPINPDVSRYPPSVRAFAGGAKLYDSSCSEAARVIFADRDGGIFIKSAPKGTLAREAAMTRFFHTKGLAAKVLLYCSDQSDWLVTGRIPGEDCTFAAYMAEPERLCDTLSERLSLLHAESFANCPFSDHTARYLADAERYYRAGKHDLRFAESYGYASIEAARDDFLVRGHLLQTDTLLHGDYCLPNIILDDWKFSGFIDLDQAGVGDRHVDIYWAVWTLKYNLKTDRFAQRFIDGYGREKVDYERLRLCAATQAMAG